MNLVKFRMRTRKVNIRHSEESYRQDSESDERSMTGTSKEKLLLHVCCGPCGAGVVESLRESFDVAGFFYNPNVFPESEYLIRLESAQQLMRTFDMPLIEGDRDFDLWNEHVAGLEQEPERGLRCRVCFCLRLNATARRAQELGFSWFATTLSVSPHKDAGLIQKVGELAAAETGVQFLSRDFKKKNGFARSCKLSKELGLYRQTYCGCVYSRKDVQQLTDMD